MYYGNYGENGNFGNIAASSFLKQCSKRKAARAINAEVSSPRQARRASACRYDYTLFYSYKSFTVKSETESPPGLYTGHST